VKLLLDQNLSDRIPARIDDLFPASTHVKLVKLERGDDSVIAEWAKQEGFTIVSKDTDFYQRSMILGHNRTPRRLRIFFHVAAAL
jgi:predicted nuclease of predicted toxin-antitoxin system